MADYTTLAYVKAILKITTVDASADAVISQFISAASAFIESETHKVFVAASGTKYFSVPSDGGRRLSTYPHFFTALTGVVNGDGTTIPSTEYHYSPRNDTKYSAVVLEASSTYYWTCDADGNLDEVIALTGSWGWKDTTAPADIRTAAETITVAMYHNRFGTSTEGAATITGAGVVITPADIPAAAQVIINNYKGVL